MAPFDRPYTTFFWSIVNIALSCTVFSVIWHWVISYLEICFIGHSSSFKLVLFERLGAVFYSSSIVTMAVSCISFEIKPDIGCKLWYFYTPFGTIWKLGCSFLFAFYSNYGRKLWYFIPPLHSMPLLGEFPSEYCHPVWFGKTRMVGLPDSVKTLRICLTIYTQYRHVTDGQTYILRWTDIHLAMAWSALCIRVAR